jgi:hypothetical protein
MDRLMEPDDERAISSSVAPMVIISRNARVNRIHRAAKTAARRPFPYSARHAPTRVYEPFIAMLKLPFKFDRS